MASGGQQHALTATHRGGAKTSDGAIPQGRFWWIAVLRGALALLLGAAALASQGDRAMLANFIGLYWLLGGLLTLRWALAVRWRRGSHLGLVAGTVGVIAASLVLLRQPLERVISFGTLVDVLGAAAVLTGTLRLLGAFEVQRRTGRRWTFGGLALGSVELVLGVVLLLARQGNLQVVTIVAVVWGFVGGSLLLIEGFRLHRLLRISTLGEG
jgi:uncharacterized membrane protein HdeD (DUF308 family)